MKPLAGIKVLDLTRVLAGPLCTQALGDLGAEVIKVESPGLGDETRSWPPFKEKGLSATFLCVNRNKRSIAIDMKQPEGRALVHRMAMEADVAIESFGTGVAERLGIDAKTLQDINPRLIHCSISGFGREGPLRQQPGYDVILQAFTGVMAMTGDQNSGHIRSPISPIDQMTGTHAIIGILAALMERQTTGKGATVRTSLFDTALALQRYNLQGFWQTGTQPAKCGSGLESMCPYQAFEALDGPIMIGVGNDNLWRKFCPVAGLEEFVDDPRFRTNPDRVNHRAATVSLVQAAVAKQPVAYWYERLSAVGVPCSPINGFRDLVDHPHTQGSDVIVKYEHPAAGPIQSVGAPYQFNDEPRSAGTPPPLLAQHTHEVLAQMGIADAEIERLKSLGIVA